MKIVVGTRGSELALAQTKMVREKIEAMCLGVEVVQRVIQTRGDRRLDLSLQSTGAVDKGLFTKELEVALAAGEIDLAVHSLKDLPVGLEEGFRVGAILSREDSGDLLVSKRREKEEGEVLRVATSSPRRALQLREILGKEGRDVRVEEIRGNVPTRLRKLMENEELDGVVLAYAGLRRLGICEESGEQLISPEYASLRVSRIEEMLPAPGQGAVAVEIRAGDEKTARVLEGIHCERSAMCVKAERILLEELGGGCHLALGVRAEIRGAEMILEAVYYPGGKEFCGLRGEVRTSPEKVQEAVKAMKGKWNL